MAKKAAKKSSKAVGSATAKLLSQAITAKKKAFSAVKKELKKSLATGKKAAAASTTDGGAGNNPPRDSVDPLVVQAIGLAAIENGAPTAKLSDLMNGNESLSLEDDLNLIADDRQRLKREYTDISESFGGSAVGQLEARNAESVEAAIDLVHNRANQK